MNTETFSRAVGAVYNAALDPAQWPVALREITRLLGAKDISLITRDMATMTGRWISTHDRETEREFWGRWRDENPFAARTLLPAFRRVETDQDVLPKSVLLRGAYYNEFWRPRDIHGIVLVWLEPQGTVRPSLSVSRPRHAEEFDRPEIEVAQMLAPHLQRAVTIEQRMRCVAMSEDGAATALDALRHGVVLLDQDGTALHVNRAAERLLAQCDGIILAQRRLQATTPGLNTRLGALLAEASGRAREIASAGAMSLPRPSGKADYAILVVPMNGNANWLRPGQPAVCVCITDPEEAPFVANTVLAALFKLTAAEISIAGELLAGNEVRQIAERLRISHRTVEAHLAHILAQTDTKRQSDLIRLLTNLSLVQTAN